MERKIVYCCSCFIDSAAWFTDNMLLHTWEFDFVVPDKDSKIDDKVFVYEKSFQIDYIDTIEYLNKIIVCCVECFEFMLHFESAKDDFLFDEINCNYVYEDMFCFNSQIFAGNDRFQFDVRQPNDSSSAKDILKKYFVNVPEVKSCFTSLQRYYYKYFCFQCRDFFKKVFLKNLYKFENGPYYKPSFSLENL